MNAYFLNDVTNNVTKILQVYIIDDYGVDFWISKIK